MKADDQKHRRDELVSNMHKKGAMKAHFKKPKTPIKGAIDDLKYKTLNLKEAWNLFESEFNGLKKMLKVLFVLYVILIIVLAWMLLKDII